MGTYNIIFINGTSICNSTNTSFLITLSNAAIFGWFKGAILSWSSAMAGAALCFYIARGLGRDAVEKLTSKFALKDIDGFFEKYGKHTILIARLLPFISFDLVSYAAGLTSMNFWSFFIATGIGQLPATIVYSYVGGMLTGGAQLLMSGLLILFALSIAIYVGEKKFGMRKEVKMTNKELKKNLEDCVNCGLCYKVCPMMNTFGESPKKYIKRYR